MRITNRSLTVALVLASVWVAACKGEAPVAKKTDPASETPPAIAAPTVEAAATQLAAPMPAGPSPRAIPPPLSSDAELHVIGVQMGAHPPDADTRPWWAKCGSDRSSEAAADCHRRHAGQRAKVTRPSTSR